jgi:hypothetical protein
MLLGWLLVGAGAAALLLIACGHLVGRYQPPPKGRHRMDIPRSLEARLRGAPAVYSPHARPTPAPAMPPTPPVDYREYELPEPDGT